MRFLAALKSLTSPEKVAELYVQELIKSSNIKGNGVCLQFATNFASDCLLAIGLNCTITVEQVEHSGSYDWPKEQLKTYRFEYQQKQFQSFEKCLALMCTNFDVEHQLFSTKMHEELAGDNRNIEPPLYLFVELMAIWCNVFRKLLQENHEHEVWLNEPLARINFRLFLNCQELGIKFNWEEPELMSICKILYKSALKGLRYRETHSFILNGLLKLCKEDFLTFHGYSSKSKNFFYEAFSVDYKDISHLKLYETLLDVLTKNNENINISNKAIITNILNELLLQPRMLEVYYNTLIEKGKGIFNVKILGTTLKFLKLLQRQMLDVTKFSVAFMEAILELCAKSKIILADTAADLYITIMRRMTTDPVILTHLLLFYAKYLGTTQRQTSFIKNIYKHFDYIHIYKHVFDVIVDHKSETIRLAAAQFLLTIICIKIKDQEANSNDMEIQCFLRSLPDNLKNLNCEYSTLILLQILRLFPVEQWHNELIQSFICYTINVLATFNNNFQYPLLMNICSLFMDCVDHVKQWQHLENVANKIMREFLEIHTRREESNTDTVHYYNVLKRLNIFLKIPYELYDNINDVLKIIKTEFLQPPKNEQMHTFMDLYAFEIMYSCILKLCNNHLDIYRSIGLEEGKCLAGFLWTFLKNIEQLLKLPVMHIKTYFNIMVMLLCRLPINMEVKVYQLLNEILIQLNFTKHSTNDEIDGEPMQLQSEQSLQYKQLMLRNFVQLHQAEHVKINTKVVWKLCLYYKLSVHKFNNQLKELLITLAKYRLNIYKHIIPVLIYNLYNISPYMKMSSIEYIILEHKQIICIEGLIQDQELMFCHIVLTLLQIIQKSLELYVQRQQNQNKQSGKNRLKALTHLHLWLEKVNFKGNLPKSLILQQLQQLEKYDLNKDEHNLYDSCRNKLERL